MNMISIRDPYTFKKIMLITESELYKHKKKLYPKSLDNLGDGYSQFLDPKTRIAILKEVRDMILRRKGLSGDKLLSDSEMMLLILDKSIELLKINLRKSQLVEKSPEKDKEPVAESPGFRSKKQMEEERQR